MIPFAVLNSLVSDVKKGSLCVNSVMILVVLSTHAELASATARGRSYWETGELERDTPTASILSICKESTFSFLPVVSCVNHLDTFNYVKVHVFVWLFFFFLAFFFFFLDFSLIR